MALDLDVKFLKKTNPIIKITFFLALVFPYTLLSQVGVNTTAPKAALDVESTNSGVLIPRVQLTSIIDNTTVVNPNFGALETSTLVYNIGDAGVVPNNVMAGFYYWNNTTPSWIALAGRKIHRTFANHFR